MGRVHTVHVLLNVAATFAFAVLEVHGLESFGAVNLLVRICKVVRFLGETPSLTSRHVFMSLPRAHDFLHLVNILSRIYKRQFLAVELAATQRSAWTVDLQSVQSVLPLLIVRQVSHVQAALFKAGLSRLVQVSWSWSGTVVV